MARNAEQRMYLDVTRTKIVEAGPDAAFLFKAEGDEITDEEAERFGFDTSSAPARRSGPPRRRAASRDAEADDVSKSAGSNEDKAAEQGSDKAVAHDEDKSA